jgi:hypothetical protein
MNWLRCGGVVLVALVGGCTSANTSDESPGNPFCALGRDFKAIGPAVTDVSGLQHDGPAIVESIAQNGPDFVADLIRMRDVLFAADCEPADY